MERRFKYNFIFYDFSVFKKQYKLTIPDEFHEKFKKVNKKETESRDNASVWDVMDFVKYVVSRYVFAKNLMFS